MWCCISWALIWGRVPFDLGNEGELNICYITFFFFLLFGDKDQCPCGALFSYAYHRGYRKVISFCMDKCLQSAYFFLCFFSCHCVENFRCFWSEILGFERDLADLLNSSNSFVSNKVASCFSFDLTYCVNLTDNIPEKRGKGIYQ